MTGRRNEAKERTREALAQAALELFATRGFAATTVGAIAERANVSERTFFLHFATKEDALVAVPDAGIAELGRIAARLSPQLPELLAAEVAILEWADLNAHVHQRVSLIVRASSSSTLRGRQLQFSEALADSLARGLARRHGDDPPSLATSTIAEIAMRLLHLGLADWAAAGPDDGVALIERRFAVFRTATSLARS